MSAVLAWPERPDGTPIVQRIVGFARLLRDKKDWPSGLPALLLKHGRTIAGPSIA